MKKTIIFLVVLSTYLNSLAQLPVSYKIDTTQLSNKAVYQFVNTFMQKDSISKEFWHPKYKDKEVWDYNMDWMWGRYSPKKFSKLFKTEMIELQEVNDTLAYFKIAATSDSIKMKENFTNIYKYYVVKLNGQYYLDNCLFYDQNRFKKYQTSNLNFYVSQFYKLDEKQMEQANLQFEKLTATLKRPKLRRKLDYYMCSSEEELNNLSNIVVWNGGLGGYTNIPEGFIVAINDNPDYSHEFIHAILGTGANCFFLQEGIASLYGGMNKGKLNYAQAIAELKACFTKGTCNFENLYAREVVQKYNSNLTYAFAAACCKYLIDNYGLDYFYKLYYNKQITSANFMEQISSLTGKSKADIRQGIEKLILSN